MKKQEGWEANDPILFCYTLPEKLQPEVGRVYPLNVHGSIVYLTKQEDIKLTIFRSMIGSTTILAL